MFHEKNNIQSEYVNTLLEIWPEAKNAIDIIFISVKTIKNNYQQEKFEINKNKINVRIFSHLFFILPHYCDDCWVEYPKVFDKIMIYKETKENPAVYIDQNFPLCDIKDPIALLLNAKNKQVIKFIEYRIGEPVYQYTSFRYVTNINKQEFEQLEQENDQIDPNEEQIELSQMSTSEYSQDKFESEAINENMDL